jgi:hypothetical protein
MTIHVNYEKLTEKEKEFVDTQFKAIFYGAEIEGIALHGDDKAERAVEAMATWIIESRPSQK